MVKIKRQYWLKTPETPTLFFNFCFSGVDGQQYWTVNYGPSYVCALKGTTVKLSCVLNYPHDQEITTVFWSKTAVTDGETPNLCLVPQYRGGVQCDSEYKDTYSLTLTSVTEADKHMYYCRFTTNRENGKWTGIPGAQLDVTGRANDLSETHTHTHARTHTHTHARTHARTDTHARTHTKHFIM